MLHKSIVYILLYAVCFSVTFATQLRNASKPLIYIEDSNGIVQKQIVLKTGEASKIYYVAISPSIVANPNQHEEDVLQLVKDNSGSLYELDNYCRGGHCVPVDNDDPVSSMLRFYYHGRSNVLLQFAATSQGFGISDLTIQTTSNPDWSGSKDIFQTRHIPIIIKKRPFDYVALNNAIGHTTRLGDSTLKQCIPDINGGYESPSCSVLVDPLPAFQSIALSPDLVHYVYTDPDTASVQKQFVNLCTIAPSYNNTCLSLTVNVVPNKVIYLQPNEFLATDDILTVNDCKLDDTQTLISCIKHDLPGSVLVPGFDVLSAETFNNNSILLFVLGQTAGVQGSGLYSCILGPDAANDSCQSVIAHNSDLATNYDTFFAVSTAPDSPTSAAPTGYLYISGANSALAKSFYSQCPITSSGTLGNCSVITTPFCPNQGGTLNKTCPYNYSAGKANLALSLVVDQPDNLVVADNFNDVQDAPKPVFYCDLGTQPAGHGKVTLSLQNCHQYEAESPILYVSSYFNSGGS